MDHQKQYEASIKQWISRFERAKSREPNEARRQSLEKAIELTKELLHVKAEPDQQNY